MRISLNSLGRLIGALLLLCCAACGPHHLPDPLTPEEHLDLGKAYEARGETERAQGQYTAAAVTVPEGDFYLGNLAAATGQDAVALEYYRKAQPDMPDDPHLNNNLAWVLCRLGEKNNDKRQLQEASALARKALAAAPPDLKPLCEDTLHHTQQVLRGARRKDLAAAAPSARPPGRRCARRNLGPADCPCSGPGSGSEPGPDSRPVAGSRRVRHAARRHARGLVRAVGPGQTASARTHPAQRRGPGTVGSQRRF